MTASKTGHAFAFQQKDRVVITLYGSRGGYSGSEELSIADAEELQRLLNEAISEARLRVINDQEISKTFLRTAVRI